MFRCNAIEGLSNVDRESAIINTDTCFFFGYLHSTNNFHKVILDRPSKHASTVLYNKRLFITEHF